MEKVFGWLCFSFLVACVIFALTLYFLPKNHQGYYMKATGYGHMPEYKIYNNWNNYADEVAFVTVDKEEALKVFGILSKEEE